MSKTIVFDEFHLTLLVPPRIREAEATAIKKVLDSRRFQRDLARAARTVLRRYPALRRVRARLSR